MASAESDIEVEGRAADGQLVRWVLHDKDNEAEVELLAEDRWVSHGTIALLRNSMKAMVPLEGTCKPEEEEAIRKEMVIEFAHLPRSQKVMFGRKAIKNYRSRVLHRKKTQEMLVGTSSRVGGAKRKGEQSDEEESRKTPRTQAQAAVALENERKQSTGSEASASIGVRTSEQGASVSQVGAGLEAEERGKGRLTTVGQELNRIAQQAAQMKTVMDAAVQRAKDQGTQTRNEVFQMRQRMDAMQRMVRRCQGAWVSVRESFTLLDEAVGGALYLTENEESASEAGEE
jgi:hypothetical protein